MKKVLLSLGLLCSITMLNAQAPANDDCANRISIAVTTVSPTTIAPVDLSLATEDDPAFTTNCETNASLVFFDVWYEFVMPVNGNIVISAIGGTETITVYDGCGGTEIFCGYDDSINDGLTAGTTYVLRYSERDFFANVSSFSIQAFEKIANDDCSDRQTIAVTTTEANTYAADFRAASEDDPNLTTDCENSASIEYLDVWYEFTMPVTGNVVVSNTGNTESFTLYDGCGGTELSCDSGNSIINGLSGGVTYILRYSERELFANASDFSIQAFEKVANDDCADRQTITVTTTETNTYAVDFRTASEDDPDFTTGCETGASIEYFDVWYEFIMPVTGNIVLTDTGSTEGFTLYDSCGGTEVTCVFDNSIISGLTAGTTYVLRYSERELFANESDFSIQAFEKISNDDCADRQTMTVTTTETNMYAVDFRAASEDDPNFTTGCETSASIDYLDVWYEFAMPVTGNIVISDAQNTEFFTLYDSCGGTEISCSSDDTVITGLTQGTTYVLRYSERELFANVSDFLIQAFEKVNNDDCGNATTLNLSTLNTVPVVTELRGASPDTQISCENSSQTFLDVWYDMTMPVDGEIQVNNVSNLMYIAFFDACGGDEISCFVNDGSLFNVEAGTNLKMRTSVRDIHADEYTFDVSIVSNALPACTGTTEFISGAWNNGTPDNTMNVVIRNNYNSSTIDPATSMPYGSIEACSVSVDTGTTVTITANEFIDVSYGITNNGTINVNHQASIVQRDDAAVVTNNGTIRVNVTTPSIDPRDFMLMGSPMSAETREGVIVNAFRVLEHNTGNFIPDPTVAAAFPMAENFADDNGDNWSVHTGLLNPAEGYFVQPQPDLQTGGAFDLTFDEGTLNNGVVEIPLLYNGDKNSSPNIISNPYPSAILADDFITLNAQIDEVFFWEHLTEPSTSIPGYLNSNFSMQDISMYNLMGGVKAASDPSENDTKPNGLIATAQGFGIKANADMGMATFSNVMRRVNGNTTLRSPENTDKIWLNITNEQWDLHGATLVGFSENASEMLDPGYDSRRLATFLGIYSHLQDGSQELGIQSLGAFENTMSIPVGFSSLLEQDDATYTISIAEIEGDLISTATVYLVDNVTGITTNLSNEKYSFNSPMGTFNNRFLLQFEEEVILNTADISAESFILYPNPAEDFITITSLNSINISEVIIYDLQGRKLISEISETQNNQMRIDISTLSSAGYLMSIVTEKGTVTKNILKK
ncbi:MAG: T9SS type A sorting domain-containing protein [Patiriisocius sp.]|uniref:T9SS type A sorting domain-containing protein n=1 Tax=Patiriisocius sp. TaxID=2822396 RepID=UPI003EF2E691